jgi:hypothetical protein
MREELRRVLVEGVPARELLALEPLLAEYDGAEVAAAALRLLERERERPREAPAEQGTAKAAKETARLFINIGTRDNVQARDLVGAIANEAGVPGDRIGRVELRDGHSLVEVPADVAEQVAAKLTGVMVRGRRLAARLDQDRATRLGRGERSERGERPERRERFPRGERPERGERGERPVRGDRFPRGERRERGGGFERSGGFERGGSFERGERGERRGGRPERGERPRGGERSRGAGERPRRGDFAPRAPRSRRPPTE